MKQTNVIKTIAAGLMIIAISTLTISCDTGSSKKKRVATTPGVVTITTGTGGTHTTCNDCSSSDLIASAVGDSLQSSIDQFQFMLNFFYIGDGNQIGVDGDLYLGNLGNFGNCSFLSGHYQVATANGEYGIQNNNNLVTNVGIEAVSGGEVIKMRIEYASFNGVTSSYINACNGRGYSHALIGKIVIESLNGQSCLINNFYAKSLYPTGNKNFNCQIH